MPSSVSGKPVERSGSTKPAAEGRSAQRVPVMVALRKARRGMWRKGWTGFASANCLRSTGK